MRSPRFRRSRLSPRLARARAQVPRKALRRTTWHQAPEPGCWCRDGWDARRGMWRGRSGPCDASTEDSPVEGNTDPPSSDAKPRARRTRECRSTRPGQRNGRAPSAFAGESGAEHAVAVSNVFETHQGALTRGTHRGHVPAGSPLLASDGAAKPGVHHRRRGRAGARRSAPTPRSSPSSTRCCCRPLPYPDPSRLVLFLNTSPQGSGPGASPTKFNIWRRQTGAFQDVVGLSLQRRQPDRGRAGADRDGARERRLLPAVRRASRRRPHVHRRRRPAERRPGGRPERRILETPFRRRCGHRRPHAFAERRAARSRRRARPVRFGSRPVADRPAGSSGCRFRSIRTA